MPRTTVTSKGQVTIPLTVREHLSVYPGDQVDFEVGEDGAVRVRKVGGDPSELAGMLAVPGQRAITLEEMDRAIRLKGGQSKAPEDEE